MHPFNMLLFSFDFLLFLFVIILIYYFSPHRWRWAILLTASGFFYLSYSAIFFAILLLVIVVTYIIGIIMGRASEDRRKYLLIFGVFFNIALLLFYRVWAPLLADLPVFQQDALAAQALLMPIGLSFHALQAISYLIEAGRDRRLVERHPGIFALGILFFPRVLSGPIERPSVHDQFRTERTFDYHVVSSGMKTMAWGFFKKMVLADRMAPVVNQVFSDPTNQHGAALIFGMVIYSVVLYADFSGYSDIAVGAAQTFGIRLTQNFNHPYSARSISEYWQRWHISLSNWLRDYIFFPLRRFFVRRWGARLRFLPPYCRHSSQCSLAECGMVQVGPISCGEDCMVCIWSFSS